MVCLAFAHNLGDTPLIIWQNSNLRDKIGINANGLSWSTCFAVTFRTCGSLGMIMNLMDSFSTITKLL